MISFSQYLKEGDYPLYHKTFTAASQAALDLVKKRGFEIDDDDWFNQVSTGPKKPGKGKTNRYIVKVTKNGKETKKRLAFQVYGMDSGKYELNAYVESTNLEENVGLEDGRRVLVKSLTKPAALRLQKKLRNKFSRYDFNIDKSGLNIIVPNEKHITRYIKQQPEVDTIGEATDLEEIVGTVALGTVVAVSTLAAMLGVVKGAKYMASKLGDAAQSYVDKKDLAAFRAIKKSKYQDEIESIAAKFDGDTKLQSMYKSLPDWSSGTSKAAFVNNADRKKKMDQIAKHIKAKLDAEESKAFAAISKVLRSKNEEAVDLEEASATVQSVLKALRLKGGKDADALIKKMKDLGLESKVSKAHADAAKKILKGQITKFVKESDKDLDAKDLENMISDPDPSRFKQYGGKDKYIKMLKTKLAKLK